VQQLLSILRQCGNAIFQGVIALSVFFIVFSLMEKVFSFSPAKKPWRSTLLDVQYAFLAMLYPPFIYFILSAIFGFLALRFEAPPQNPKILIPLFAGQLMIVLFLRDCLIYFRHRIFHLRPVWTFHSIHHSSEEVNWISAVRFHPAENVIETTAEILLFLGATLAGFYPGVLSVAGLVIGVYNFFIHSNLRWTFGPLRYIFVSPVFHRWHHSDAFEATDKNFASMFSCIDLALGTFYMPVSSMPHTTGLSEQEKAVHPRTFAGQLLYPFKKT
jgi:sterol desaturase/sphingolipid hydroxylase (fatty acid hydroxylase superfamily)